MLRDMNTARHSADLQVALGIADRVDVFTMERFRAADLSVETKPDMSPVSDADLGAERIIRDMLGQFRSRDAILGEEEGETGLSGRRWIIDPKIGRASCRERV